MKAAVYLRVSTDRQDERNQEPETLKLCEARGWEPLIIRETGSAKKYRPGWERQVFEWARVGEVRAVVVWSVDRIGRSMFRVLRDVLELERMGCLVVSVRESWLEQATVGPMGTARNPMLAMMAWVAEHEHERLSERTRAGLARARAAGKVLGRPSLLSAAAVERAAVLRAGGESWARVVRTLETERFGHDLTRGAVQQAVATRGRAVGL